MYRYSTIKVSLNRLVREMKDQTLSYHTGNPLIKINLVNCSTIYILIFFTSDLHFYILLYSVKLLVTLLNDDLFFHRDYFFKGTCSSFLGSVQSVYIQTENTWYLGQTCLGLDILRKCRIVCPFRCQLMRQLTNHIFSDYFVKRNTKLIFKNFSL